MYKNNLQSIVELKASSDDVGDSYGTAVFIDKEGTLVTNAHVVTYKKLDVTYEFDNLSIRLATEDKYREVKLIKFNEDLDITVLKLSEPESVGFKLILFAIMSSMSIDRYQTRIIRTSPEARLLCVFQQCSLENITILSALTSLKHTIKIVARGCMQF